MRKNNLPKNQDLLQVEKLWHALTPAERKWLRWCVWLRTLPRRSLHWLDAHIARRRAQFAHSYPAHWLAKHSHKDDTHRIKPSI